MLLNMCCFKYPVQSEISGTHSNQFKHIYKSVSEIRYCNKEDTYC